MVANDQSSLILHMHPLASYCWKVLIALYESETAFRAQLIGSVPDDDRAIAERWPLAKMPLLQDGDHLVPETSIIIEYLQDQCPGAASLIPADGETAREVRLWDRFCDLYVHTPMQKCVSDRLRPEGDRDAFGVDEARAMLDTAYAMLDRRMTGRDYVAGDAFSMADCAAMPPLFYVRAIHPFDSAFPALAAYFERLLLRPSVQRVLHEAQPWFQYFPFEDALEPRFRTGAAA